MIDARVFDDISRSLGKMLPPGMSELKDDFERNAKATIQSALGSLDLVTREEFDIQTEVLRNTRLKLKMLEERLSALEPQTEDNDTTTSET
jgi:BMFP domain-containing protein YqiC